MRHLFATRADVLRLSAPLSHGIPTIAWGKVPTVVDPLLGRPGEVLCRLDLTFQRPGKDQPMPIAAGRAPDRLGVMFYTSGSDIRAGDRIVPVTGPIQGIFEVRAIPDVAEGYAVSHHMEVQVIEVAKAGQVPFPGAAVEDYRVQP